MLTATTVILALSLTAAPAPSSPAPSEAAPRPIAAPREAAPRPIAAPREAAPRPIAAPREAAPRPIAAPPRPLAPRVTPRSWWHASYLVDWGLVLGLGGLAVGLEVGGKPHHRQFELDDPRISYPLRKDTVPAWAIVFPATLPLVAIGLAQIPKLSWHDVHHASLGLMETMAMTFVTTLALKLALGRLRPDFLARCQPTADGTCTGDPDEVQTGRESFPSGHTSLFFAGGAYLTLYLWGKLKPFRTGGALWKVLVLLAPLAAATAVGVTRLSDYRHHWEDVLAGALLGTGFAMLGYRLNFPWPWSKRAGRPETRTRWAAFPILGPGTAGLCAQGTF